jgi:hypothetical protein
MLLLRNPIHLENRRHIFVQRAYRRQADPVLEQSGRLQEHIIVRYEYRLFVKPFQLV